MFRSVYHLVGFIILYIFLSWFVLKFRCWFMSDGSFFRALGQFREAQNLYEKASKGDNLTLKELIYLEYLLQTLLQSQRIWNWLDDESEVTLHNIHRFLKHTKRLENRKK